MNITTKIIITDTNIITDLNCAGILDRFVMLDNVYVSDMVLNDEVNGKTGNIQIIKKMKVLPSTSDELVEMQKLLLNTHGLSPYDLINFILARDHNCILATGDNLLRSYAIKHGVEVFRTLKIIQLMIENHIITGEEAICGCKFLLDDEATKIPKDLIVDFIKKIECNLVNN